MFHGLFLYFIFSWITFYFEICSLFALFFLCCRISILPIISYKRVLVHSLILCSMLGVLFFRLQRGTRSGLLVSFAFRK